MGQILSGFRGQGEAFIEELDLWAVEQGGDGYEPSEQEGNVRG